MVRTQKQRGKEYPKNDKPASLEAPTTNPIVLSQNYPEVSQFCVRFCPLKRRRTCAIPPQHVFNSDLMAQVFLEFRPTNPNHVHARTIHHSTHGSHT